MNGIRARDGVLLRITVRTVMSGELVTPIMETTKPGTVFHSSLTEYDKPLKQVCFTLRDETFVGAQFVIKPIHFVRSTHFVIIKQQQGIL